MRLFLTDKAFRAAAAKAVYAPDPAEIVLRYSDNPNILKRAMAAFYNWDSAAPIEKCNVSDSDVLLAPYRRIMRAVAEGLAEERAR